jgi:L-threonylcarbamoyladenylate synthase
MSQCLSLRGSGWWQLELAVAALRAGGLVLHATEGVWGLACDPLRAAAVARLLRVKSRTPDKGLIVIGADAETFAPELDALNAPQREEVLASWPGRVTWLLPSDRFPHWITGGRDTVAVRVPGHAQARALCRKFGGPLVSTFRASTMYYLVKRPPVRADPAKFEIPMATSCVRPSRACRCSDRMKHEQTRRV